MNLSKEERGTVVSLCTVAVSLILLATSLTIPVKRGFQQSAMIFPLIVTGIMTVISVLFFVSSVRRGYPTPKKLLGAIRATLAIPEWKNYMASILIVAVYIFAGIPLLGYYLSSLVLVAFILLVYLRRIKPWVSVLAAIAVTALLYLIFVVVFKIPLR